MIAHADMVHGWLTGWKRIAAYLDVSAGTAKKYYKKYGLPICRHPTGAPTALPHELDIWLHEGPKYLAAMKKKAIIQE